MVGVCYIDREKARVCNRTGIEERRGARGERVSRSREVAGIPRTPLIYRDKSLNCVAGCSGRRYLATLAQVTKSSDL